MNEKKSSPTVTVHQLSGLMKLFVWLLSLVVRIWQSTLRFEVDKLDLGLLKAKKESSILLMWHNQIFSLIGIQNRFRKRANSLHALTSASKDGAFLSSFLEFSGIQPVRGSSSKRGVSAAKELLKILKEDGDIAITMDGPRGPIYHAHSGGALVAILSNKPIHLISCNCKNAWRLKSWDRFYLPVPFSKIVLKLKSYPSYEAFGVDRDREAIRDMMEVELNKLHDDDER